MMFKTRYTARVPSEGITFTDESLTLQSEYPQTTIDYYLKRYSATGLLGDPNRVQQGQYLDVSNIGDFQDMQNKVLAVRQAFMELPAEERRKFGDDPAAWVESLAVQSVQPNQSVQTDQPNQAVDAVEKPADQATND